MKSSKNKVASSRPYFIFNPGTHPELIHMASGLIRGNVYCIYATSLAFGSDHRLVSLLRFNWFNLVFGKQLRKRIYELPDSNIVRLAVFPEIVLVLTKRYLPSFAVKAIRMRNHFSEKKAMKILSRFDPLLLVSQHTGGHKILKLANELSIPSILNYPIAHHLWINKMMKIEAQANPEWALFLQGHDSSHLSLERLSSEIENSDFVLVGSNFVRETFMEMGVDGSKVVVIRLGANLGSLQTNDELDRWRRKVRKPEAPLNCIFVGQLTQRKGISYLLDSFKKSNLPKGSSLTLIGSRPNPKIVKRIRQYPFAIVMDHMSQSELMEKYFVADLFILPSLVEGFALTALEAMQTGIPVVVSSRTLDDIIESGHNGIIVPPNSESHLIEALEYAAREPEKVHQMGLRGKQMSAKYTWVHYGNQFRKLTQELVESRK